MEHAGYGFESETDTEVIAHLLAFHMEGGQSLEQAFRATVRELHGSYAIAGMCVSEPETLVVTKSGCPLVLGQSDKAAFLASDVPPLLAYTRNVTFLEDGDIGTLTPLGITVTGADGQPVNREVVEMIGSGSREKGGIRSLHAQGNS